MSQTALLTVLRRSALLQDGANLSDRQLLDAKKGTFLI
jgi:hypothetical protein